MVRLELFCRLGHIQFSRFFVMHFRVIRIMFFCKRCVLVLEQRQRSSKQLISCFRVSTSGDKCMYTSVSSTSLNMWWAPSVDFCSRVLHRWGNANCQMLCLFVENNNVYAVKRVFIFQSMTFDVVIERWPPCHVSRSTQWSVARRRSNSTNVLFCIISCFKNWIKNWSF